MPITSFQGEYRWLSNFWPAPIVDYEGIQWPSVEHAYQAAKATNQEDKERIRNAKTPGEAKRLGKIVDHDSRFTYRRLIIMHDLVYLKFIQDLGLQQKLLDTGEEMLIEGNYWHDNFWGQCQCQNCNIGQNHLVRFSCE